MTDYLLDTNHLAKLIIPTHPLTKRIHKQIRFGDTFSVPSPALAEMLYGVLLLSRAEEAMSNWEQYRIIFHYYHIDEFDAEEAARLQVRLRREGEQLQTVDALIAVVAIRYDLTLLTTDADFHAISELNVENWLTT
ncbi:MAG: type II toxin-antitoxin system VapC family toxin [Chloroflexota bacterium]